jgi:hypothetical protein
MEFLSGLLWGAGLSLGCCVGLVAWVFLRTLAGWLLGHTEECSKLYELNLDSVAALRERNRLGAEQIWALRNLVEEVRKLREDGDRHV